MLQTDSSCEVTVTIATIPSVCRAAALRYLHNYWFIIIVLFIIIIIIDLISGTIMVSKEIIILFTKCLHLRRAHTENGARLQLLQFAPLYFFKDSFK